jgi:hypothetical protein
VSQPPYRLAYLYEDVTMTAVAASHNKQLQRTATRRRGRGASAPFHDALAPPWIARRAAAELRRYALDHPLRVQRKEQPSWQ